MRKNLGIFYDLIVKKGDEVVNVIPKTPCNSFTKQFAQLMLLSFAPGIDVTITDTAGAGQTSDIYTAMFTVDAGLNNDNYGSAVGTGTTAVTINDYDIETQIAHGTSAGQLQYSATVYGAPSTDAAGSSFVVTRVFTNDSGGSITINEIGIIALTGSDYALIVRDVLGSPPTIANGETVTLNYTFQTTV